MDETKDFLNNKLVENKQEPFKITSSSKTLFQCIKRYSLKEKT